MVVTEQNARASLASRLAGRFAKACAVPFEGTDLPRAVVTGNPVRPEILAVDRARDRDQARAGDLDLPLDRTVIGVASGSFGSTRVNQTVAALAAALGRPGGPGHPPRGRRPGLDRHRRRRARRSVGHRPGRAGVPPGALRGPHRPLLRRRRPVRGPGRRLDGGRADGGGPGQRPGAAAHRPRDDQTANAEALVRVGAAVLVPDAEFDADRLATELTALARPIRPHWGPWPPPPTPWPTPTPPGGWRPWPRSTPAVAEPHEPPDRRPRPGRAGPLATGPHPRGGHRRAPA